MNELASLGRRAAASVLDLGLACLVAGIVLLGGRAAGLDPWVGALAAAVSVAAVAVAQLLSRARVGRTVGGAALGLWTVDERWGTPVGLVRALRRTLVVVAGGLVLGVGAVLVLASPALDRSGRRRGWHDRMAGTVVLHRIGDQAPITQALAVVPTSSTPAAPAAAARPAHGPGRGTLVGLMPELEQTRPAAPRPQVHDGASDGYRPAQVELELSDGTRRVVRGTVLVGRNPIAGPGRTVLRLADPSRSLSRTHACLVVSQDGMSVEDLGSTNGTLVQLPDGGRVVVRPGRSVPLPVGSFIGFGDCWVRLVGTSVGRQTFPEPATER
ncbi:MAG: RDD family protein [Cellulomonas sp.]|nr:RDD family protein [Cellulomonas sp.]